MANQNPISQIQGRYGLSDLDFSRLLDVSVITLRTAKRGEAVHPKAVLTGLSDIGYDSQQLFAEYTQWRDEDRRVRLEAI